jgi:hypothetical protein
MCVQGLLNRVQTCYCSCQMGPDTSHVFQQWTQRHLSPKVWRQAVSGALHPLGVKVLRPSGVQVVQAVVRLLPTVHVAAACDRAALRKKVCAAARSRGQAGQRTLLKLMGQSCPS